VRREKKEKHRQTEKVNRQCSRNEGKEEKNSEKIQTQRREKQNTEYRKIGIRKRERDIHREG